jgi:uncharacterized membrane protein
MKLRVNLTVEEEVLKKAKYYAEEHNTSVSELVEEYLKKFTARTSKRKDLLETIRSLKPKNNYRRRDLVKEYYEAKGKKHGR